MKKKGSGLFEGLRGWSQNNPLEKLLQKVDGIHPAYKRSALTVFIIFHICTIVVLSNGSSILVRKMQYVLTPYANHFGLNAQWNFFSPDPAHTMFIEAVVNYEDELGQTTKDADVFYLPPEKTQIVIDSSKRRLLYAMRYLLIDQNRIEKILAPWLCDQYKGATSLNIKQFLNMIPPLDAALRMEKMDINSDENSRMTMNVYFDCKSAHQNTVYSPQIENPTEITNEFLELGSTLPPPVLLDEKPQITEDSLQGEGD